MLNFTHFCDFCTYKTTRKYNLIRHQNNKHLNQNQTLTNGENGTDFKENLIAVQKTVTDFKENLINFKEKLTNKKKENNICFYCLKCGKKYKTQKFLNKHEIKCNGLSSLQCPKCMKIFSHRSNKSDHIKNVNCIPKSILNNNKKTTDTINNSYCLKCGKKYKTQKYLNNHQIKCNGLNSLQCPKCMKLFSHYSNKSNHIKNVNCIPKSILNDKEEQTININNITNNVTNNITNVTNNITNVTNIYINNYGSERIDYITFDDIIKIMRISKIFIIPEYIKIKHFNKDFPENHNIKFNNRNDCLVKQNNDWVYWDLNNLSVELLQENLKELNNYYVAKEQKINTALKCKKYINETLNNINHSYITSKPNLYQPIKNQIKSIIRTSRLSN